MDEKELEQTKPIDIVSDDNESRSSKYADEENSNLSRAKKYEEVVEEEQSKVDEEEAEEALAEKNIALAESYLASEETSNKEEEIPQKVKLSEKIKEKWESLDKKQKIMFIVILVLVLILIIVFIAFLLSKPNNDLEEKPEEKVEEVAPVITDNYYYKDGKLFFLDEDENEIGSYECENDDSKLCYVADNNYRDKFDVVKLENESGEEKLSKMPIYDNNYVFVIDNKDESSKDVKLYSIKDNELKETYTDAKAYDDNYVIVATKDKKYGLLEIKDGIKEAIKPTYEYLGLIDGEDNLITKTKKGYVVINKSEKAVSSEIDSKYEIKNYNNDLIVAKIGEEYVVLNYKNEIVAGGYEYATISGKYAILVNNNNVYVVDSEKNKYNEGNIILNNKNYVKTYVYNDNGSILRINRSFEVNVKDDVIEIAVYKEGEDNPTYKNIDITEGLANKKNKYVNYFEGTLYIYRDEEKTQLLGTYSCTNKNYVSSENDEFKYCFIAKDTVYEDNDMAGVNYKDRKALAPVINNRYVFVLDGSSNVVLYDLVEAKKVSNYSSINSYTKNNDYTLTYYDGKINVAALNQKGKFGMITIDGSGVSLLYPFEYNKLEKLGDNMIALNKSNNWQMLSEDGSKSQEFSGKIMGYSSDLNYFKIKTGNDYAVYDSAGEKISIETHNYVDLYNGYYVGIDSDKNLNVYDYQGEKITKKSIKLGDYPYTNTDKPAYKIKKDGSYFVISVFDGKEYVDHNTRDDVNPPEEEEPTE